MPLIAFLGCDGSGKSTVIRALGERLEAEGKLVSRGHWQPNPFRSDDASGAPNEDPHGQPPRGGPASVAKLGWIGLNWWVAWFRGLGRARKESWVLFDRYHGDLLVDPRRYRYGGALWLAKRATAWMPQPDRVIFLDAPAEVLLSRKQEVPKEALEELRGKYRQLCGSGGRFRIVDCARPLEDVVEAVLAEIDG